ncbi:sensor histidine kinase [Sinobaca sp. H24]|uniref:ATP-binding protein n=1 Tax=Sinobaca sp. H24 TaxID=2923376 RepID=UPI00207A0867|nr:sensor histidine kinase [Sinobaca sp. H24]
MKITIRTKIIFLVSGIIAFVTILLSGSYAFMEMNDIESTLGDKALSTATYVAASPVVRDAFSAEEPSEVLQPYAERIRRQSGAEFVVIGNTDGIRYAHPDPWQIGESMVGGDNDRALLEGEAYISKATGTRGPSLRGKTPVRDQNGDIVGIVSVGFLIEDLQAAVFRRVAVLAGIALLAVACGVIGSILLSRSIKKDMYGLEPYQIANMYSERNGILKAIREGVIAIDTEGRITLINQSAAAMLGVQGSVEGRHIKEVLPSSSMDRVLESREPEYNQELQLEDTTLIVNREPIFKKGEIAGVVSSFRDKTEMMQMANTLSDIQRYSDDLRSQNHEFMNKLYALSGYLHLGRNREALQMIDEETNLQKQQASVVFGQILDPTIQAILSGKSSRASEMKVTFRVEADSQLDVLPSSIGKVQMVSVLGNLIDNALEAAGQHSAKPEVRFFVTDIADDIVFEISDNGPGLADSFETLLQKGVSTKSGTGKRGYGLSVIQHTVHELHGMLEYTFDEEGTIFSVYIPKHPHLEKKEDIS